MTKGQDALKHWKETNTEKGVTYLPLFVVELIEKELKELQAIKEAKRSEALECLEFLKQQAVAFEHSELAVKVANENYSIIKQALLKAQEDEQIVLGIEDYLNLRIKTEPREDARKAFIEIRNQLHVIKEVLGE